MTPQDFEEYIDTLVTSGLNHLSTMIWGPPGIGKSSIVAQVARRHGLRLIDLRLGQLAPTDLRGLPVPEDGVAQWYPPEFLPHESKGILFMDELNMAAPVMQGIAQQLILDRRVGSYAVPEGWFVWAAGNRKEDQASVYEMPAPLRNRFIHLTVEPHYPSWQAYAARTGLHEQIQAFLAFRSDLLFEFAPSATAFPTPRTWEIASDLHAADLDIAKAVGEGAAGEFYAYLDVYERIPSIERILAGRGDSLSFPEEPSVRYAIIMGLATQPQTADQAFQGVRWCSGQASDEFIQLLFAVLIPTLQANGKNGAFLRKYGTAPSVQRFLKSMGGVNLSL